MEDKFYFKTVQTNLDLKVSCNTDLREIFYMLSRFHELYSIEN